jgi:hypothetical protein
MALHGWREDLVADDGRTVRFAILSMHTRNGGILPRVPEAVTRQNLGCTRLSGSLAASLNYSAACLT